MFLLVETKFNVQMLIQFVENWILFFNLQSCLIILMFIFKFNLLTHLLKTLYLSIKILSLCYITEKSVFREFSQGYDIPYPPKFRIWNKGEYVVFWFF